MTISSIKNIILLDPKTNQQKIVLIACNIKLLLLGPFFYLLGGACLKALTHLILSCVSFGFYWVYLPFIYYKCEVIYLLNEGFVPYSKREYDKIQRLNIKGIFCDKKYFW